jgi:hypothetical protein
VSLFVLFVPTACGIGHFFRQFPFSPISFSCLASPSRSIAFQASSPIHLSTPYFLYSKFSLETTSILSLLSWCALHRRSSFSSSSVHPPPSFPYPRHQSVAPIRLFHSQTSARRRIRIKVPVNHVLYNLGKAFMIHAASALQVRLHWLDACFLCAAKAVRRCGNVRNRREGCTESKGSLTEAAVDASRAYQCTLCSSASEAKLSYHTRP